jgi:hypothetical protein
MKTFNEFVSKIETLEKLAKFATDDFQKRGNGAPKSDIPVNIRAGSDQLTFVFKNTDEKTAEKFVEKFVKEVPYKVANMKTRQTGDYEDDWVETTVVFKK